MDFFRKLGVEEAEAAVLASILLKPDKLPDVSGWLPYTDVFWKKVHKDIWESISDLYNQDLPIDPVSIYESIRLKDPTFRYEYLEYLLGLRDLIDPDAGEHYAKIVWRNYLRREAAHLGRRFADVTSLDDDQIESLLVQQSRYIEELLSLGPTHSFDIAKSLDKTVEEVSDGSRIIRFNLPFLDEFAGGATRGELVTIGGRPGSGKTLLALNILDSLARQGYKVMMFNREMTNSMALSRLIVMNSPILRADHLRSENMEPWVIDEMNRVKEELKKIYADKVIMFDDISDLGGALREIRRHKPDVFIDDYIQLVSVPNEKRQDRRFEVERIMIEYKWIAKKINATGILLSQLNRESEKRETGRPNLGDYAESGTIEQLAELCVFIRYPYAAQPKFYSKYETEIIVLKARYGRIGGFSIGYNGARNRFYTDPKDAIDEERKTGGKIDG